MESGSYEGVEGSISQLLLTLELSDFDALMCHSIKTPPQGWQGTLEKAA